jgi:hypothetical protein
MSVAKTDYWTTVTLPVLDAVGQLEETGVEITYASISELSGVDQDAITLLVERLHRDGDGEQWIAGVYMKHMGPMTVRLAGLGPLGMQAVRGFPGREAIIATLERLAEQAETEEDRGALRRAASIFRAAPAETVAAVSVEVAKRLAGVA